MPKQLPALPCARKCASGSSTASSNSSSGTFEAADELGLSPGQMSRLRQVEDVFTLDRLIDAAANTGITVRMNATRPYGQG